MSSDFASNNTPATGVDVDAMRRIGEALGRAALPGDVIALIGDLAAGKTTLARAIAIGAGVPPHEYVTSPAYDLVHEYDGRVPVFHMDFYRLESFEPEDTEWFWEHLDRGGLSVIEWADRVEDLLPSDYLRMTLQHGSDASERLLEASAVGTRGSQLLAVLQEAC